MTDSNSYIPQDSPQLEFVYNNESELQPAYWPVFYSQFVNNREANELYNDDPTQYVTYSGVDWKRLMVSKEKDGRYRNFTMKSFSGESFDFYFELGSLYSGNPSFYSGPTTLSGAYKILTYYSGEADAISNSITFTAPADNTSVFVLPDINTSNYIKLHHRAVASGESYRLSQFLPRTLIQVDDLEADVIDAVTIRVSDSIVVTADDLADGSITGAKILAGTVSGVLITPGTITANEISVGQLDAIASNMGTLFVNSGITIGEDGFLWTGPSISGEVLLTKDGLEIDNAFALGSEVMYPGGGGKFVFSYVPRSRLIRYYPTNYTSPLTVPPTYTLTTYSGSETYFDISASQLGEAGQNQDDFNGYASRIQTGYGATSGIRNDYAETIISTTASGEAYLTLSANTWNTTASIISLTAGTPGNRISITGSEFNVQTATNLVKDNLTVYKDVSQESPYIKFYSNILEASSSSFKYRKPMTSTFPNDSLDLFTIDNTGNGSLYGSLTVSGALLGKSGTSTQYEMSSDGIIFRDSADNSLIFKANATGITLNNSAGGRIIEISTSTGNLDIFGGDFFMYNSAESSIVASISKTGVSEFTTSVESPTFYVDSNGTASAPSVSWSSDTDTGIYRISDGYVGITSNTVLSAGFFEGQIRATNGSVDAPAYSFINDTDSGIYRSGSNIAFSLNGSLAAVLTTNNVLSVNGTNQNGQITVEVPDGTARNALAIRQLNDASAFINFVSNGVGATFPTQTSALGTYYGKVRVQVNGTVRWIALYNT
jgi:hypothetical protein